MTPPPTPNVHSTVRMKDRTYQPSNQAINDDQPLCGNHETALTHHVLQKHSASRYRRADWWWQSAIVVNLTRDGRTDVTSFPAGGPSWKHPASENTRRSTNDCCSFSCKRRNRGHSTAKNLSHCACQRANTDAMWWVRHSPTSTTARHKRSCGSTNAPDHGRCKDSSTDTTTAARTLPLIAVTCQPSNRWRNRSVQGEYPGNKQT